MESHRRHNLNIVKTIFTFFLGENMDALMLARHIESHKIMKDPEERIDFLNLICSSIFSSYSRFPDNLPLLLSNLNWLTTFSDGIQELYVE